MDFSRRNNRQHNVLHVFLIVCENLIEQIKDRFLVIAACSVIQIVDNVINLRLHDLNPLLEILNQDAHGDLLVLQKSKLFLFFEFKISYESFKKFHMHSVIK